MILDSIKRLQISPAELVQYIIWKYNRNNLSSVASWLQPDKFAEFLSYFAGNYIKVPPASKIHDLLDRYRLVLIYRRMQSAHRDGRIGDWERAERQLLFECKRLSCRYETAKKIIKAVERDLKTASDWSKRIKFIDAMQNRRA